MFEPLRICLVGATGLVGERIIEQAVGRQDLRIIGVARREAKLPKGARMDMLLAPVEGWADAIAAANAKVLVCALGTTWKKADKDEAAFRAVDHDLVIACGKAAKAAGIEHMIVVSSVGADPMAKGRYLRTKGEMEGALSRLRFRRLDVLRPGMLRGPRGESRPLERVGQLLSPLIDLFLHGKYRPYRSVSADTLALAVFALTKEKAGGHFVHDHDGFHRAIRRGGG
ncbi:MAG: NAD(P)H-binding protein [Sphingomonadales bacterium]|nr:NAD(P)H-binding protein [Sphingomonadales bacterium]